MFYYNDYWINNLMNDSSNIKVVLQLGPLPWDSGIKKYCTTQNICIDF